MDYDISELNGVALRRLNAGLEQHFNDIVSIEDSIASLEAIVTFFDEGVTPSLEDLALADLTVQNAVTHTDVTSEELLPALESYVGKSVSTESVKDTILKYYKVVMDFIKRIYEGIKNFLFRLMDDLEPLKEKVSTLLTYLDSKSSAKVKEPITTVGPSVRNLVVAYKLPNTYDDLVKPLAVLRSVTDTVFKEHASLVSELSNEIVNLNSTIKDGSLALLLRVNEAVEKRLAPIAGTFKTTTTLEGYTHQSAFLFNNHAVFAKIPKLKKDADVNVKNEVQVAADLRTLTVRLGSTESPDVRQGYGSSKRNGEHDMTTMTAQQQRLLLSNVMEILNRLIAYRNTFGPKLEAQAKASNREAGRVTDVILGRAKLVADGGSTIDSPEALKAVLNYHSAIAKWSSQPFNEMAIYCTSVCKNLYRIVLLHSTNLE